MFLIKLKLKNFPQRQNHITCYILGIEFNTSNTYLCTEAPTFVQDPTTFTLSYIYNGLGLWFALRILFQMNKDNFSADYLQHHQAKDV